LLKKNSKLIFYKMPKIILDYKICIFCGLCANICPAFFKWNANKARPQLNNVKKNKNKEGAQASDLFCIKAAIDACPVSAIYIKNLESKKD